MATAFNETEKALIRQKLNLAAKECLGRYGIKKTTVDQLVQIAGISKGAFYGFYPSKEILFFKVMEDYQKSIVEKTIDRLVDGSSIDKQELSNLFFELYKEVKSSFIINIVQNQELEYLFRKLPEELILQHHDFDDLLLKALTDHVKIKKNIRPKTIAAALRAIFMSLLHVKEIGEADFDEALKLLISGLVQQLFEEDGANE